MAAPTVPLTWRNVSAPDGSGALNAFNRAGENLGNAIGGLGENLRQGASDYADFETQQFIADLNAAPDDATRNQMVQDASQAFLKMDQVNKAVTDAQNQDFRVNQEARAAKKAEEDTRLFEQTYKQTDKMNPLRVRQLDTTVKGAELKLDVDEEFLRSNADYRNRLLAAQTKVKEAITADEIATSKENLKKIRAEIKYAANAEVRKQNEEGRRQTRSTEQTGRFNQEKTKFENEQDDRKRGLGREKFINTELAATSDRIRFPTTLDRYTHLQGIIKNAASSNITLTADQRARVDKELAKVSSRLRPQDVLPTALRGQFTQAFTNLARRPKLLPNNQPALNNAGNPVYIEPTATEVALFASDVSKNIARLNPDLDKADIERIAKETMAGLPQFSKIAKTANLKDQVIEGTDKAVVEQKVESASWNARIDETPNRAGLQNLILT